MIDEVNNLIFSLNIGRTIETNIGKKITKKTTDISFKRYTKTNYHI